MESRNEALRCQQRRLLKGAFTVFGDDVEMWNLKAAAALNI